MIRRPGEVSAIEALLRQFPVVAVLGARQVGKTTLARMVAARSGKPTTRFDLEDAVDVERLTDPTLALGSLRGLVVVDEVQRRPNLFPALRVLADRPRRPARFLILGSASPELLRQSAESLAGRIAYHELGGFSLTEVGTKRLSRLWLRGGFPASFLSSTDERSLTWRKQFARTFLERDIPELGVRLASTTLARFWTMLAHYHGQTWNASAIAGSFGVSDTTVRGWLDVLTSTFMIRQLTPWHENIGKRQVRAPKIFFSDSGLLHALLDIRNHHDLERHPKLGASWEGFAMMQVAKLLGIEPRECHFWATHQGAELDLLVVRGGERRGFEFKRASAPSLTRSMHIALHDLGLSRLDVVHAGDKTYPLGKKVRAIPLSEISRIV